MGISARRAAEEAASIIESSEYVIAFTGAGISAEAGIPVFRGKDGLWNKYDPMTLATPEAFARDPRRVWEWYAWRIGLVLRAEPTVSHRVLAGMEKAGILQAVVTQNVDGLHQRAGSINVIELHGSILRARCTMCGRRWSIDRVPSEIPVRCPYCGGLARPDVVWFGEPLPSEALYRAFEEAGRSDAVIVVGTTGYVEPAGSIPLIVYENGGRIINVNLEPNRYSNIADVDYRGRAGEFFDELGRILGVWEG